jgi:hypothetical protein
MRTRWALALLLVGCAADPSSNPPDDPGDIDRQDGACSALEDQRFGSLEEHECGLTPDGVALCQWQLEISALDPQRSMFMWRHSDVIESGSVRCTGRQLSSDGFGPVYTGTYDPGTQRLIWDDLAYRQLP